MEIYLRGNKVNFNFCMLAALFCIISHPAMAACNIIDGKAYGDCSAVTVNRGSKPALSVRGSVFESAIVEGATIYDGGSLTLSGLSEGDVVVQRGGSLNVTGTINGYLSNNGGVVSISGVVAGVVLNGGSTTIDGIVDRLAGDGVLSCSVGASVNGKINQIAGKDCR